MSQDKSKHNLHNIKLISKCTEPHKESWCVLSRFIGVSRLIVLDKHNLIIQDPALNVTPASSQLLIYASGNHRGL